ncbi:MAG: proton-conducting transporter membrane subunit [Bacteroidota bacterium]
MSQLLQLFIWVPLFGFLIGMLIPAKKESILSGIAISTIGIHLAGILTLIVFWLMNSAPTLDIKHIVLFETEDIEIFIDFYFDKITAVFAVMGSILTFLVTVFSHYYLHREEGFKRFFTTILLFFLGYNLVIFSGNFETLFIGWEILGICSFLLIAFYRDRYLPVKNGLKVLSVYRLGDICLILAMWMSHHLWHENITFLEINDLKLVASHIQEHNWYAFFIALMILIAAAAKSAQLPFSSWLPRAMEGPTTSSAVFYGSLSVHLGVFLLLRTFPYWESIFIIKVLIICTGIFTGIIATSIAKVQSSVKTQIAYSSIAQIGLIFIEVALCFHILALLHFSGNAFLRAYQLLVSPSVLGYKIHDMVFNFVPKKITNSRSILTKIKNSFYILSLKEWNLDFLLSHFLWNPFKWIGKKLDFLANKISIVFLITIFLLGVYCYLFQSTIPTSLFDFLPFLFSFIGLILILKAFAERGDALWAWGFVIAGQLFITLSIALLNENFGHNHILMYLSGSVVSAIVGFICLKKIRSFDNNIELNQFHGYTYEHPKIGFIFLLSCLGTAGLPFTPTFIGIDLIFSNIHKHQEILIIFTALSFVFIELAIVRIYARVFLGQHKKNYHAIAYRSS